MPLALLILFTFIADAVYADTVYILYTLIKFTTCDDPKLNEFIEVGVKSARLIGSIVSIPPLYRYHIPTRTYREFLRTLNKVQDIGEINTLLTLCVNSWGARGGGGSFACFWSNTQVLYHTSSKNLTLLIIRYHLPND